MSIPLRNSRPNVTCTLQPFGLGFGLFSHRTAQPPTLAISAAPCEEPRFAISKNRRESESRSRHRALKSAIAARGSPRNRDHARPVRCDKWRSGALWSPLFVGCTLGAANETGGNHMAKKRKAKKNKRKQTVAVCTENLSPDVMVMKSTKEVVS